MRAGREKHRQVGKPWQQDSKKETILTYKPCTLRKGYTGGGNGTLQTKYCKLAKKLITTQPMQHTQIHRTMRMSRNKGKRVYRTGGGSTKPAGQER